MTTTYEHGSWAVCGTQSPLDYIVAALGEYANEYNLANVETDFILEIQKGLPDHTSLQGTSCTAPNGRKATIWQRSTSNIHYCPKVKAYC